MMILELSFSAKVWQTQAQGAWFFVTLPNDEAKTIKFFKERHLGFGTISVWVKIKDLSWQTSLFPDQKSGSYLLPLKASIRRQLTIEAGHLINIELQITK